MFKKVLSWVVTVVMMFSVFFTMPITANAEDTIFYEDGTNEIYFDNVLVAASDTTAPVLTAGAASRISDTNATVTFTSNEAGQYYYAVVEKDADEPVIDTGGSGTACDTTEQTITLDSLTPGAKDIYIVVKDAAGNISEKLKINIESFNGLTAYGWVAYDAGTGINTGPFTVSIPTGSLQSIKNVEHDTIWMSGGDFVDEFNEVLEFVETINNIDTENVEPTYYLLPLQNVWRSDEAHQPLAPEDVFRDTPERDGSYFKVPRIL
jgi:aspartyl/glutamyl-tRNA(Asn/Gln) amidotransferase C subunit